MLVSSVDNTNINDFPNKYFQIKRNMLHGDGYGNGDGDGNRYLETLMSQNSRNGYAQKRLCILNTFIYNY